MSNDLLALWAAAEAAEPDSKGLLLRAKFADRQTAASARIELYRLRKQARTRSRRGLDPDDPRYDTSPWDTIRIVQPGADRNGTKGEPILEFYLQGRGKFDYEVLPPEVEAVAQPVKRRSKKEAPD